MIHVTPPQSAPDFIKSSSLANAAGWVDVDKHTLQHVKFANIFSLGDSSGLPISKTGAAIRKQAPVVVENMLATINHLPLTGIYNGYTSCPLVTGYGKLVLAEFDYDNIRRKRSLLIKAREMEYVPNERRVLPWLYWNKILPGKCDPDVQTTKAAAQTAAFLCNNSHFCLHSITRTSL